MKFLKHLLVLFFSLLVACSPPANVELGSGNAAAEAVELFDGESLNGWQNFGGGNFYVEDGTIVGEAAPGLPNSFLATDKMYGDFELEVEFKVGFSMMMLCSSVCKSRSVVRSAFLLVCQCFISL